MTDPLPPPITPGPGQQLRPSRRQYRLSDEHSPSRTRTTDDLLSRLTPMTAVQMLQTPNTELKQCLDNSTVSEQEFALRAAVASRKIYEWLEELSDWPWPATSGSAGFETPETKRVELDDAGASDTEYLGCLPAKDVAQYEQRVDGISHDMDELHIEDIKTHVMHTHIIPLSRPGTPKLDSRSVTAAFSYNRMDDLTALLTAIIIQALPNLSKLCRLLKVWHVRLSVLRRIPALLTGIAEAEFALESAWNVLSSPAGTPVENNPKHQAEEGFSRLKHAFTVVKGSGGLQDTLPDAWLDRMEAVERNYADWVASGEQKMREGEWQQKTATKDENETTAPLALPAAEENLNTVTLPVPITIDPPEEEMEETSHSGTPSEATPEQSDDTDEDDTIELSPSQLQAQKRTQPPVSGLDGSSEVSKPKRTPLAEVQNESTQKAGPSKGDKQSVVSKLRAVFENNTRPESFLVDDAEDMPGALEDEDEIQLPPLVRPDRRGSDASELSTVIHGHTSLLADASSDMPEVSASPPLPRQKRAETPGRKPVANRFMSVSPPSSPPFRPSIRDHSVSPVMRPQDEGLLPALPLESSFIEEEYDHSFTSVGTPRESNASDDHLRQQISDILESIPANIKLARATPKVDLNPPPPDLPAKRLKKPSRETIRRTGSSMSMASRASSQQKRHPSLSPVPFHRRSPIKLFIRCVGEHGERVMVRVGGGWADLGEYLKEYATHHGRRSAGPVETAKVEVQDLPRASSRAANSSPPSRPASALEMSPMTPLNVRKSRKSFGAGDISGPSVPRLLPNTPAVPPIPDKFTPSSEDSNRSRSSSHISWEEEESSFLGLAGPTGRKVEMSEESRAWVESVKEKVRLASGEARKTSEFGDMGKVGGTKRLFRKG
ncbi:hypothetical protein ColLi_04639 [Colletotrichum liriopes]|uniref:GAR domain-containing protein n=1 Tax=Colletotrichum liriopes TaxID=708192 RepID=A0AA37GK38_9PEZI|nr:hypothetical protein ColLi_04639 [Colletotrichum liriopes]